MFDQTDICTENNLAKYFVEWLKKQNDKEISLVCQFVKEGVLKQILKDAFPNKFIKTLTSNTKKSQYILKECIENIFATLILEEYRHPNVVNLELDYFLPEYNVAFEYQVEMNVEKWLIYKGKQHYDTGYYHRKESIENVKARDQNKVESCKEKGKIHIYLYCFNYIKELHLLKCLIGGIVLYPVLPLQYTNRDLIYLILNHKEILFLQVLLYLNNKTNLGYQVLK